MCSTGSSEVVGRHLAELPELELFLVERAGRYEPRLGIRVGNDDDVLARGFRPTKGEDVIASPAHRPDDWVTRGTWLSRRHGSALVDDFASCLLAKNAAAYPSRFLALRLGRRSDRRRNWARIKGPRTIPMRSPKPVPKRLPTTTDAIDTAIRKRRRRARSTSGVQVAADA